MNKPLCLGISILDINKKQCMCFDMITYTDSFIVCIETEDVYQDKVKYVKTRFDNSNSRPEPKRENEKVIKLIKDELGEKVMTKFVKLILLD